jgi:hypothetical protein
MDTCRQRWESPGVNERQQLNRSTWQFGHEEHVKTGTTRTITKLVFLFFGMAVLAVSTVAEDPIWPRQITKPGGKLVLYQPQVD